MHSSRLAFWSKQTQHGLGYVLINLRPAEFLCVSNLCGRGGGCVLQVCAHVGGGRRCYNHKINCLSPTDSMLFSCCSTYLKPLCSRLVVWW
jgi:hypothetical protein